MDTRVHAHIDQSELTSLSIRKDNNSVVVEPDRGTYQTTLSQEDVDIWFNAFRSRYAETLAYLQSH